MLIRRFCGFAMMVGLSATGCGGGSNSLTPRESCEQAQSGLCERVYACFTPAQISEAGLPPTEAECVTGAESDKDCAHKTLANACVGSASYHGDQARLCADQVSALTCSQLSDVDAATPACAKVCS